MTASKAQCSHTSQSCTGWWGSLLPAGARYFPSAISLHFPFPFLPFSEAQASKPVKETGCGREEQRWQAEEVAICEIFTEKGERIERSWGVELQLEVWVWTHPMCARTHTHMHIYMCFHDKYIHRYKQKLRWMLESVYIICIYIYIYMYIFTHFKHFPILSTERT